MDKGKICYITTIPGTMKFFMKQMKYLRDQGFTVYAICSPGDTLQEKLGSEITYIPISIARGISPLTIGKSVIGLVKVFRRENFDIVQYSTPNAAFVASIATKLAGVKIRNYHLMGLRYITETGLRRKLLKFLEKVTCYFSTHIECISQSNLELAVQERLFNKEKAVMVWNGSTGGVDLERFSLNNREQWRRDIRHQLGLSESEFVFGFAGRITRDKGINEILRAFRSIKQPCKLLMIGKQEGIETIDAKLWEYAGSDENIILIDAVEDIERYYAAMDVLLLPSYREGFGMVIAEAAAVGTPAIVSNIPGPVDVIDAGKTALTVEVKNADDLAEKMQYFLNHPEMVEEMAKECTAFIAQKFDSNILCEKILERKRNLLESQGK